MRKEIILIFLASYFNQMRAQQLESIETLKLGDKAPALEIIKWIKGEPIREFKRGHIYVIEFGYVACTPCRASIPLLTEIARKYSNKVSVVSVHIYENDKTNLLDLDYINRVEKFVVSLGPRVGYNVALDVPEQTTAIKWLEAAGLKGVPRSFIVDQKGIIVWIGSPYELDAILEKVIVGEFNFKIFADQEDERQRELDERFERIWAVRNIGNYNLAFAGIDSLIRENPDKPYLYYEKFRIVNNMDDTKADALVRWLLSSQRDEFDAFMHYLVPDLIYRDTPNYNLAIEVVDRAISVCEYKPIFALLISIKAEIYYKMIHIERAIELQEAAIDSIKVSGMKGPELADHLRSMKITLNRYRERNKSLLK